jgi:hypothetical protein
MYIIPKGSAMTINRTKLQSLCHEADLPGWAESHEHLSGLEKVLAVLGEPTPRMVSEGESAATVGIGKPNDDEAIPRVWHAMWSSRLGEGG